MINFVKNKKNIILSSSILNGINTFSTFCADENKKNIEIIVKYKGFEYKASNIEVTKDNFAEPEQRIEFIKANKDKFISGTNKLNCTNLIKEVSEIGKWENPIRINGGPWIDEYTLGECNIVNKLNSLEKATIEIDDYIELKYIKTDKKLKNKQLEEIIESDINDFAYKKNEKGIYKEIDKNRIVDVFKKVIKARCEVDVNDDIFIFDKNADENGIIKESCTLKINFPDSLIEGNPDPKPTDPNNDNKNNNKNNNKNGSSSSEDNKKTKSYCGS